jgi:photosystem II stability/assembly factor-like uncharacterized protein
MLKKRIIWLTFILWLGCVHLIRPIQAQTAPEEPGRIYLPLISRMDEAVWLGPESADVVTIAYDRQMEDRVYLGTWGAGVFVSDDGGLSWRRRSSGLGNLYIQRLTVDPQRAEVVYAGTYGGGVYKTMDGGWNWYPINQGMMNGAIVYGLAVDPQQPERVYASVRPVNRSEPPWGGVVYRSTDGGQNWQAVLENIGGSAVQDWVYSLAVDPQNPRRVLAASHEHGAYRSLDFGASWRAANTGISDLSGRAVAFDPRGSIAYLGVWHRTGEFKTLSGGDDWFLQSNGLTGSKIYDLVVNPRNPNQLLAATFMMNFSDTERGVARSDNGGEMWVKSGLQPYFTYSVAVNPFNGNEMLAGTVDYGVFRSTDGGKTWTARNQGLVNVTITDLLIDPLLPQVWYAAVQGRGVFRSQDGGVGWEEYNTGMETYRVFSLAWDVHHPGRLLALTPAGWLAADSRGEGGWHPVDAAQVGVSRLANLGTPDGQEQPPPRPGFDLETIESEVVPNGPAVSVEFLGYPLLTAESGMSSQDDLPAGIRVFTLLRTPQGALLAGTSDGVFMQPTGGNWQAAGLNGRTVVSLAVHPLRSDWIAAASPWQVWLSQDGGSTWQEQPTSRDMGGIGGVWFDGQGSLLVSVGGQGIRRLSVP